MQELIENAQFTVYPPQVVSPGEWIPLLAFAHLSELPADAPPNALDPITEVKRQAELILGANERRFRQITQDAQHSLPREGEIVFIPTMPGVEFNPPCRSFLWMEAVHREEFHLRASPTLNGQTVRGCITVLLGRIILAEIYFNIRVDGHHQHTMADGPINASDCRRYRRIFASYSRRDVAIVEDVERYASILGDLYVRDLVALRTGEVWSERLTEMIQRADIFQLFWSSNSMRSRFVQQEWEYALALKRKRFVRPVYWEDPLPEDRECNLPPDALRQLHFQRLTFLAKEKGGQESHEGTRFSPPRPSEQDSQRGPNPIQDVLKQSRKSWVLLTQTTVWIAGAVAALLLPPPSGMPEESRIWVRFSQFVITVVIGMVLLAALRWKQKKDMLRWGGVSMLFLFLGTAAFFCYQICAARWTAIYDGKRVVIGDTYTALGREYHEQNPRLPPQDMVTRFAGQVEKIWTRETIEQRRLLLAAIYVLAMPLFTMCIVSIIQALHCAVAKTKSRKRAASPAVRASH